MMLASAEVETLIAAYKVACLTLDPKLAIEVEGLLNQNGVVLTSLRNGISWDRNEDRDGPELKICEHEFVGTSWNPRLQVCTKCSVKFWAG